jgi:hypothetical protein
VSVRVTESEPHALVIANTTGTHAHRRPIMAVIERAA